MTRILFLVTDMGVDNPTIGWDFAAFKDQAEAFAYKAEIERNPEPRHWDRWWNPNDSIEVVELILTNGGDDGYIMFKGKRYPLPNRWQLDGEIYK